MRTFLLDQNGKTLHGFAVLRPSNGSKIELASPYLHTH